MKNTFAMRIANLTTNSLKPFKSSTLQKGDLSQSQSCALRNWMKFRTSAHDGSLVSLDDIFLLCIFITKSLLTFYSIILHENALKAFIRITFCSWFVSVRSWEWELKLIKIFFFHCFFVSIQKLFEHFFL